MPVALVRYNARAGGLWSRLDWVQIQDPISKMTKAERAGAVTQAVQPLPSKREILISNLSTTGKKKDFHWCDGAHL
jgi:hypothetical protein